MTDARDGPDDINLDALWDDGAPPPATPATTLPGTFFGPYQLLQEVGKGGVASVHRARHIHPQYAERPLVVKILHPALGQDPMVLSLFRREAYVLSLLKHPGVVQTFEAGDHEGRLFIAMEYVEGRDLEALLARCRHARVPVPRDLWLHVAGEVLRALIYAHALRDNENCGLNLVHRDINPANVFLSYAGRVKLGDFGVASITAGRLEKTRELAGKIGYFAPEQIDGGEVDQRADLFALGAMMFEMIGGVRLFEAADAQDAIRLNRRAKIPKLSRLAPDLPQGLTRLMLRALERRPQDRYSSGAEMLAALAPFLPNPKPMRLALMCLMRGLFVHEYVQETLLQESLAGRRQESPRGQLVDLAVTSTQAARALHDLLAQNDYRVRLHADIASLIGAVTAEAPYAVVVEPGTVEATALATASGSDETSWVPSLLAAMGRSPRTMGLVAFCPTLETPALEQAVALGAADVLCKPLYKERVLACLAGIEAAPPPGASPAAATPQSAVTRIRDQVLLVGRDDVLRQRVVAELRGQKMRVDVCDDLVGAMARLTLTSYRAAIYDAHPSHSDDRLFAGQLRAAPGIGLLPVLILIDAAARAAFRGMPMARTGLTDRTLPVAMALAEVIHAQVEGHGRLSTRFACHLKASMRYGGRLSPAIAIDMSRGGLMLQCEHIPSLGAQASVMLQLGQHVVQATGRVVRVGLGRDGGREVAQVGVEFDSFAGQDEARLIAYLGELQAASAAGEEAAHDLK